MKWYWLTPKDQRRNNWILYKEVPPVKLRVRYRPFQCAGCGKINEDKALLSGFDTDICVRARSDIVLTSDNLLCFSKKAQEVYLNDKLQGLEFLEIPGDSKYKVVLPTYPLPVDLEKAGFQYEESCVVAGIEIIGGFCEVCGRPKEGSYVGPMKGSFELPENPLVICAPVPGRESSQGKIYWILISEVVKKIFQESRLSGVEYNLLR